MSQTNDNFDNLWASLKDSIRQQRGERQAFYTYGEDPLCQMYGGRILVDTIEEDDDDKNACVIRVNIRRASVSFVAKREDLIQLAAQCLGAVADMDEQQTPFDASAHGHLITEQP